MAKGAPGDQRHSAPDESRRLLLLTLAPSHYCERARWALDYQGISYDEERLAPGAHILRVKLLRASATYLPLLLARDGAVVHGSDRILDWTGMTGGDPEIERRFEQTTAPLIRRCLYAGLLSDPQSGVQDVLFRVSSRLQATLGRLSWPLLRRMMVSGMSARPNVLPELIVRVDHELDWFEQVLSDRGNHLVGNEFGRADLTAASLLAPIALLQTEPVRSISAGIRWPQSLAPALERWSNRASVKWVRRIYEAERAPAHSQNPQLRS